MQIKLLYIKSPVVLGDFYMLLGNTRKNREDI